METDYVACMDALELLNSLEAQSVDAIITDLPYGTTACAWDTVIPFEPMWKAIKHALKPRGVFVTTASQPFTSALVMSNPKWFRYEWVWWKLHTTGFLDANIKPLKEHESVLVFSGNYPPIYYPQYATVNVGNRLATTRKLKDGVYNEKVKTRYEDTTGKRYPTSILKFRSDAAKGNNYTRHVEHPTQKPVALYEYLILTYTQPNALVVDPFAGSGTTLIAARNTGRHYIGGDTSAEYVDIARKRLALPFTEPMWK